MKNFLSKGTTQAGRDITTNNFSGLSYSETKEVFNDLFEQNFYKLKKTAQTTVNERVEEITDEISAISTMAFSIPIGR